MLNKRELQMLIDYLRIQEVLSKSTVVLLGGSLSLKIRGLLNRDIGDLDIVINKRKMDPTVGIISYTELYDLDVDPDSDDLLMNRIGVLRGLEAEICIFYNKNLSYDNCDSIMYNGKMVLLQPLGDVLKAKAFYADNHRTNRDKHANDILKVKLRKFIENE